MARTIFKYPLRLERKQALSLHRIRQILTVQTQDGYPVLWAMVNPETVVERVTVYCLPTGQEGPPPEWSYIGTVQLADGTVWHYFHDGDAFRNLRE